LSAVSPKSEKPACANRLWPLALAAVMSLWMFADKASAGSEFEGIKLDKLLEMAETETKHKRCPAAIKMCDEIIRRDPHNSQAYIFKAQCIDYQQSPEAAATMLEAFTKKYPPDAGTLMELGALYNDTQQFDKAIAALTRASSIAPQSPEIFHRRSMAYGSLKKHELAIADLTTYIKLTPTHNRGYQWRADEYRKAGQPAKAIADLNLAIAKDNKKDSELLLQRADLYLELKDYDSALADYSELLKRNSLDDSIWFKKGQCCMQLKDYVGAVKAFTAVLEISDSSTAYYARSEAYAKLRDFKNAQKDKLAGDKQARKPAIDRL
jgi:tetratricopeptide (TPR) repeat protein